MTTKVCDRHNVTFTALLVSTPALGDLLDTLRALRPLWLPLLVVSFAAGVGLVLVVLR